MKTFAIYCCFVSLVLTIFLISNSRPLWLTFCDIWCLCYLCFYAISDKNRE
jgi:hypothetical protein